MKYDFRNVNSAENAIWKCEFLEIVCEFFEIYDFEQVIFWIQCGFLPQCASTEIQLGPDCQMANYVTKEVQSLYM